MGRKQLGDKDKLFKYNKETVQTNIQFKKIIQGIVSVLGLVFDVNVFNS